MQQHNVGALVVGLLEGVLSLRLVALLFAARPDNLWTRLLLTLTEPLIIPFRILDWLAEQPQFGARLELATLAAMSTILITAASVQWLKLRRKHWQSEGNHHAQSEGTYR